MGAETRSHQREETPNSWHLSCQLSSNWGVMKLRKFADTNPVLVGIASMATVFSALSVLAVGVGPRNGVTAPLVALLIVGCLFLLFSYGVCLSRLDQQ